MSEPVNSPPATADQRFAAIAQRLVREPDVTLGSGRRGFGTGALQIEGRMFAMLSQGRLVVKLPADRVAALIADRDGSPFDAGKGKPLREWVVLAERSRARWLPLVREAEAFGRRSPRR